MRTTLWSMGLILLLTVSGQPSATTLPPGISGAWYNPAQPGHGLTVEILDPDRALVFWHVFEPDGDPLHLYVEGRLVGNEIRGQAWRGSGMRFGSFDPADHELEHWGLVNLRFDDCNAGELEWFARGPAGAGYPDGTMPVSRLTGIAGLPCGGEAPPPGLYRMTLLASAAGLGGTGVLLLSQDGAAWFMGEEAIQTPGFVFAGGQQDGSLSLTGHPEPSFWANEPPHPIASRDLAPLALVAGADPGSWRGLLEDGSAAGIAPLILGQDPHERFAVYRRSLRQAELAGTYVAMHGFLNAVHRELQVDAQGRFAGRDFSVVQMVPEGCRYEGALELVPGTAELSVTVEVSGCGPRDGSFAGKGFVADVTDSFHGLQRVLRFAAVEETPEAEPGSAFQFRGARTVDSNGQEN